MKGPLAVALGILFALLPPNVVENTNYRFCDVYIAQMEPNETQNVSFTFRMPSFSKANLAIRLATNGLTKTLYQETKWTNDAQKVEDIFVLREKDMSGEALLSFRAIVNNEAYEQRLELFNFPLGDYRFEDGNGSIIGFPLEGFNALGKSFTINEIIKISSYSWINDMPRFSLDNIHFTYDVNLTHDLLKKATAKIILCNEDSFPFLTKNDDQSLCLPVAFYLEDATLKLELENPLYVDKTTYAIFTEKKEGLTPTKDLFLPLDYFENEDNFSIDLIIEHFGFMNVNIWAHFSWFSKKYISGLCKAATYCVEHA